MTGYLGLSVKKCLVASINVSALCCFLLMVLFNLFCDLRL